mgnify:CR=1 FL=1
MVRKSNNKRKRSRYLTLDDLEYVSNIDSGSYSTVYLYRLKNNREKRYAVKMIKGSDTDGLICLSEFFILKNISNKNIIGYRGHQIVGNTLYIILENAETSLLRHVKDNYGMINDHRDISNKQMAKWIFEMAYAIYILHDVNIVHCDIKSDNVLVFPDGKLKIADFGMSSLDNTGPHLTNATSFRAPEIWRDMIVRKSIDMWSFGCVLYDIYFGGSPFYQRPKDNGQRYPKEQEKTRSLNCINRWDFIRNKMLRGTYSYNKDVQRYNVKSYDPPSISSSFDPTRSLEKLILKLLDPNPDTRATAYDILEDPYLKHVSMPITKVKYDIYSLVLRGYNDHEMNKIIDSYSSNVMTKKLAIHFVKQLWSRRTRIKHDITTYELADIAFFMAYKILRTSKIPENRFILPKPQLVYYEKMMLENKIVLDLFMDIERQEER